MKSKGLFFVRYVLFWLLFFLLNRVVFTFFYWDEVMHSSWVETFKIIPNSLRLDMATVAYSGIVVLLIYYINSFFGNKKINIFFYRVFFVFQLLVVLLSAAIIGGETAIYQEWSSKLNYKAISHFANPTEVISTASTMHIFVFILFICFGVLVFIFLHNKLFKPSSFHHSTPNLKSISKNSLGFIVLAAIFVIMLRGGVQKIPINTSDAYFSSNTILNDIAVNPNYNIIQSILLSKNNVKGNPYQKHATAKTAEIIKQLYHVSNDSSLQIIQTQQPNIVFILLESWSADNIAALGGYDGITPHFNALLKKGFLFDHFYAAGWTSDQGMSSILSSFPVFPHVAVANHPDKARKLPCINKNLKKRGYNSSFFFGGQLTYGNIKGYLLDQGFEIVKDENAYPNGTPKASLGIHDEYMFSQFHREINQLKTPFFTTLFTVSSHSPYDIPRSMGIDWGEDKNNYLNAIAYTDSCLGIFMKNVEKEPWYNNTLFIIMADHSHNTPRNWDKAAKEHLKIPMLWYGEVLKSEFQGKIHQQIGSQLDISKTLLNQLNIESAEYRWSKDLLNPTSKEFSPFTFHRGYGWINEMGYFSYDEDYERYRKKEAIKDSLINQIITEGEAFFQSGFEHYLNL